MATTRTAGTRNARNADSDRDLTPAEVEASVKKMIAEADQATAAAEESRARVRTEELSQQQTAYLIEHSRIEAEAAKITLAKLEREERFSRVNDLYHKRYTFDDVISDRSVKQCINTLTAWSRDEPECAMWLYINSPGGDIVAGFALIDFLTDLRSHGHHITTIALGMAASMAAVLLQAGDVRVMGKNATLLLHEGSLGVVGTYGEAEDQFKLMRLFHEQILDLFVSRAHDINAKTTKAFLRKEWKRTDFWVPSAKAKELGLVDDIQ